ncbi:TatD family hydrolase [Candidatus Saccharibacteria bacterium]|nr:TatD family hydrolase [Candidatus Saccharibacteria bacterium]
MFTDTHCHIHEDDYPLDPEAAYTRAMADGVDRLLCVGTSADSSARAMSFAAAHAGVWAVIGIHPHEAAKFGAALGVFGGSNGGWAAIQELALTNPAKLVGIGECGLDYYYHDDEDDRQLQRDLLRQHLELASALQLPVSFHVRDAFDDFWPIFDEFKGIRGVLHSFTDSSDNLAKALERGLYIGVNGISTFTKIPEQITMFSSIPLEKLLLETDAPYLTPKPLRGSINEPAFITHVARSHAALRGIPVEAVATATDRNATSLFSI